MMRFPSTSYLVLFVVALSGCMGAESAPVAGSGSFSELLIDDGGDGDASPALKGVFALKTVRSDDPRYPVGHTVMGSVDIDVYKYGGEVHATFNWLPLNDESMIRYTFTPTVESDAGGTVKLDSTNLQIAVDSFGRCPRPYLWGEIITPKGRGVGIGGAAQIRMNITSDVTAPEWACDAPDSGVYHETALIAVSTDRPGLCFGDQDCEIGFACNAGEVCLPPPACMLGGACPAVCTGWCYQLE